MPITVSQLYHYPVKSLGGIPLHTAHLNARGIEVDRHWMVVDNKGKFRTQREVPKMALIQPHIGDERSP